MSQPDSPEPSAVTCPECGQALQVEPGDAAHLALCPACGMQILIPAADGSTVLPDVPAPDADAQAHDPDAPPAELLQAHRRAQEQELNGLRMRQILATKRTAMRTQSYFVVGAAGCAVGAAKLAVMTWSYVAALGWQLQPVGYVLTILALLAAGVWCVRRVIFWGRQSLLNPFAGKCAKCSRDLADVADGVCPQCGTPLPVETEHPDFSTLSDGSHFARDLEDVK